MMLNAACRNEPSEVVSETNTTQNDNSYSHISSANLINISCHGVLDRASSLAADPWSRTLTALLQFSTPPIESPEESTCLQLRESWSKSPPADSELRTFTVTVLERLAGSLVALSWRDPTLCNYEEQVWSSALARRSGRCALSGLHISRGDTVYKPRTRGGRTPLNGDAMILASALQKVRDD